METTVVSRFDIAGGKTVRVACSCGSHKLTIGTRSGQVWLQVPCFLCEGVHFFYFTPKEFWHTGLGPINCSDSELRLGVFGRENEVDTYMRTGGSELDRLREDEAFSEYFDEPAVMYEALSRVHHLAAEGNLFCSCGNPHIGVEVFPERLELTCSACGRHQTIQAGSEADLALLETAQLLRVGDDASNRLRGHEQ